MQDDKRQRWVIVALVSILLLGGTAVGLLVVPRLSAPAAGAEVAAAKPPPSPENANEYVASAEFEQKPLVERMQYMQEHREQLDRDTMRRQWRQRMQKTIDEWYALPDNERVAYLDRLIDEWEDVREYWREQREQREAEESDDDEEGGEGEASSREENRGRGRWEPPSRGEVRQHIRERTEATSPEERAKQMAFFRAMMSRRAERGLSGPSGGRFGRPH